MIKHKTGQQGFKIVTSVTIERKYEIGMPSDAVKRVETKWKPR